MKKVREEVALIFGVPVEDWDQLVSTQEQLGRFDEAKTHRLVIMLCKKLEEYESTLQSKSK